MARRRRPAQQAAPVPQVDRELVANTVSDVRKRLQGAGRKEQAEQLRRAYGDDLPCYGVKPVEVHNIGLDLVRRLRSPGYAATVAIAEELYKSRNLEEGLVGAQIMGAMARHIGGADFDRFEAWANWLSSPQSADALGVQCISRAMAGRPSIALKLVEWAKSDVPWRRIAAVSSFSPLVREGRFMTDALTVAEELMTDESEEVQKAVGTMLMEMTRLKSPRVVEFLEPWKGKAQRSIVQAAATKLTGADRQAVLG